MNGYIEYKCLLLRRGTVYKVYKERKINMKIKNFFTAHKVLRRDHTT